MKRLILAVAGLGALAGLGIYMNRATHPTVSAAEAGVEWTPEPSIKPPPAGEPMAPQPPRPQAASTAPGVGNNVTDGAPAQTAETPSAAAALKAFLDPTIETLVSPQSTFEQRQAAWKRLKEAGKLNQAIAELEQRAANDPRQEETVVALGAAYLKKAGQIEDVREKAILAMKADQTLEEALSLDPSNWEARYTKAVGMSYWPAQLNKKQEVIEQFQALIQQQEVQAPQPQFARSYLWLGDQYREGGHADSAAQVWQRGAALFPDNEELKSKLASMPARP